MTLANQNRETSKKFPVVSILSSIVLLSFATGCEHFKEDDFLRYRIDNEGNVFVKGDFDDDSQSTKPEDLSLFPMPLPTREFEEGRFGNTVRVIEDILDQRREDPDAFINTDELENLADEGLIYYSFDIIWAGQASANGGRCHWDPPAYPEYHCHPYRP